MNRNYFSIQLRSIARHDKIDTVEVWQLFFEGLVISQCFQKHREMDSPKIDCCLQQLAHIYTHLPFRHSICRLHNSLTQCHLPETNCSNTWAWHISHFNQYTDKYISKTTFEWNAQISGVTFANSEYTANFQITH